MDGVVSFDLGTIFLVTYMVASSTGAIHMASASFLFPASIARLLVASSAVAEQNRYCACELVPSPLSRAGAILTVEYE